MEYLAYTDNQIRTLRALLDLTEVRGVENCTNIVNMRQIIDSAQKIDVKEDEKEDKKDGKENL